MEVPFERWDDVLPLVRYTILICFSFSFAALIYRLGNPSGFSTSTGDPTSTTPVNVFASWLNHLPKPLAPHSGKYLFRLLFPHEGSRRRYGLKETKLTAELERLLGIRGLSRWDSVSWDRGGDGGTGCLGREVELIVKDRVRSSSGVFEELT